MIYLIKLIFFILISQSLIATENKKNEILFKINNKVFTNIDLEKRTEYVALISDLNIDNLSSSENKEILDDYISSLIFYEYYIKNKMNFKNLKEEVNTIYKRNVQKIGFLNEEESKNFKSNTNIDLVRNKIIEKKLNLRKEELLQEVNKLDLLYNYNLQYIIINENLLEYNTIKGINDRNEFNKLKVYLEENRVEFFYKEEDINDNTIISNKIKKIIMENIPIYISNENGYINLYSINKNLESYEGIFVKLINFKTKKPLERKDLQCNNLKQTIDINKTAFKEYEYSKLNNKIKNNLKSINDYIIIDDNNEYNYIILCDLTYDEDLLKNINFNKNVNHLVIKIQNSFLKKYKNEYNFIKIK